MNISPEFVIAGLSLVANVYMALVTTRIRLEIANLKVYMHQNFEQKPGAINNAP